jgi:hypothetical protein
MSIMEEQNKNDEHHADLAGNMDAPTISTSAKKVYSKPTLVVLSQSHATGAKSAYTPFESLASTGPS